MGHVRKGRNSGEEQPEGRRELLSQRLENTSDPRHVKQSPIRSDHEIKGGLILCNLYNQQVVEPEVLKLADSTLCTGGQVIGPCL